MARKTDERGLTWPMVRALASWGAGALRTERELMAAGVSLATVKALARRGFVVRVPRPLDPRSPWWTGSVWRRRFTR